MALCKVVIFDVDGTLYDQKKLRKRMLVSLLTFFILRPWKYRDLLILHRFRQEREKRNGNVGGDLENRQYEWCAQTTRVSVERIKRVVEYWVFKYPNPYLASYMYPGVKGLFQNLKERGVKIAIYSDYKAVDKISAMGLEADLIVSSTDEIIDRLKPDPKAINYIMNEFNVASDECLFIGDREELDGQCAVNAGVPYQILDKNSDPEDFFAGIQKKVIP